MPATQTKLCTVAAAAAAAAAAEDVAIRRPEWSGNRLEQHLTEVLRQLGEAFANAAGSRGGPVGQQLPQTHFPTAAGIDLLQVRSGMMLVLLCLVVMCCGGFCVGGRGEG